MRHAVHWYICVRVVYVSIYWYSKYLLIFLLNQEIPNHILGYSYYSACPIITS